MKPSIVVAAVASYACMALAVAAPVAQKLNAVASYKTENTWIVNQQPMRAAPGLIVYGQSNRILQRGQWPTADVKVQYQLDLYGQLWRVWVISQ